MKIVYLNPIGQMGGAESALLSLLASLRDAKADWRLHFITPADGQLTVKAAALGVTTHVLPFPASLARLGDASAGGPAGDSVGRLGLLARLLYPSFGIGIYALKLRRLLRQIRPDVVHTNGFKMHVLAALAKPRRVPLFWHIHDYVSTRPVMCRLLRILSGRCSLALANSNSVKDDLTRTFGGRLEVATLYNGIDTKVFSPIGPTLDLDLLSGLSPAPPNTLRVGLLATMARWKGHETFLRAIALLPHGLALRAYVIGGAIYQTNGSQHSIADLKAVVDELEISDRVGFTNFVDEPATAMRSLDIVVHASTEPEPFGLVIAEAMSCGRAVIASGAGGAAEIIEPEINALSHVPGDANSLAQQILSLATDSNLRQRLGDAGRHAVAERFAQTRLAKELIPIYSRIATQSDKVRASDPNKLGKGDSSDRVQGLDSLRFICAMWVVFLHCGFYPLIGNVDKTKLSGIIAASLYSNAFNGPAAVIVFFVISGFCINFPYSKGRQLSPVSYFSRRYIRIVIPMVVAILLARPLNLKFSLLSDSILWSLLAEEIYYVIYPLLLISSRSIGWIKIFFISCAVSVGVVLTNPAAADYPSYGPYLNWLLGLPCWLLGCLLAQQVAAGKSSSVTAAQIWSWRMAAWALSSFCSVLRFHSPLKYPWTLNVFAVFVYFWLTKEIAYFREHRASRLLERGGKWSYSIYLLHLHGQALFVLLAFSPFGAGLNWVMKISFVLLVSYTFYRVIEKPSHGLARKVAHKLLRPSPSPTPETFSESPIEQVRV